jgi:hypothetical protein
VRFHVGFFITLASVLALGMQACARKVKPQESCNFVQNPDQQRVSWKGKLPVRLFLHSSVPSDAYGAIDRAVNEYNTTLGGGREIFKIVARGAEGAMDPQKDGTSMVYWFNTWDADRPTEQARTTIYWSGVQIFEADIRINAKNFHLNLDPTNLFSDLDLESLLVHELGHGLGLAHNSSSGSVMNFSLNDGQDRRKLNAVDLSSLRCEY